MKISKKIPIGLILIVFVLVFRAWHKSNVMSDGVRDTAVVTNIHCGKKGQYLEYQYEVNGVIYHNQDSKTSYKDVQIGDSFSIMYKRSDPEDSYIECRLISREKMKAILNKRTPEDTVKPKPRKLIKNLTP